MSFNPYLFFSGDCAEAFAFYGDVFGVEPRVMKTGDMPPGEDAMPGADADTVMHASIELNGAFLMGSDDPSGDGGPKAGFAVSYTAADASDANRVFAALGEGGTVTMPIEETFWSPAFGVVMDRFGVAWMVDTMPATDGQGTD